MAPGLNQSCFFHKTGSTKRKTEKDDDVDNFDSDAKKDEEKETSGGMTLLF